MLVESKKFICRAWLSSSKSAAVMPVGHRDGRGRSRGRKRIEPRDAERVSGPDEAIRNFVKNVRGAW